MNITTATNKTNTRRLRGRINPIVTTISIQENPRCNFTEYLLMHRVTSGNKRKNSDEKSINANTRRPDGSLEAIRTDATIDALSDTFPLNVVGFFTVSFGLNSDGLLIVGGRMEEEDDESM